MIHLESDRVWSRLEHGQTSKCVLRDWPVPLTRALMEGVFGLDAYVAKSFQPWRAFMAGSLHEETSLVYCLLVSDVDKFNTA